MIIKKISLAILLVCLMLPGMSASLAAKEAQISRQQAIAIVQQNLRGKILKVKLKQTPHGSFYRVKLLTRDGRVKIVRVDSQSGDMLANRRRP